MLTEVQQLALQHYAAARAGPCLGPSLQSLALCVCHVGALHLELRAVSSTAIGLDL